ncbi:hypothetical protein Mx8p16 [Myxococcus phage Mx8]|uniref:p16 n=1 Tax=Myxococcus phage Mx8 TaxID=49964 RepID=Q94MV3_9CAUD|nr:hypothetical protein Mx8p16 [Myxococcus phage Mx8]AAK94351.1 p16 [Myxococcus phage Mx8]
MSPLKFKALSGVTYEVHRGHFLIGRVERLEERVAGASRNPDRLSRLSIRWQFQVLGQQQPSLSLYMTRQKAAEALARQYDAHQRAQAKAVTP